MEESKSWVIFKRFLRGFIATAIPIVTMELSKGYDLSNPNDLKKLALSLLTPLMEQKFPIKLLRAVHNEYFVHPF
jgi:hypothetical protein